jgi:hypothetical protein
MIKYDEIDKKELMGYRERYGLNHIWYWYIQPRLFRYEPVYGTPTIYNHRFYYRLEENSYVDVFHIYPDEGIYSDNYKKTKCTTSKLFGMFHSVGDLPAIECEDGHREWYQYGRRSRADDKPAIIDKNGNQLWLTRKFRHKFSLIPERIGRDGDKPALITATGLMAYFKDGVLHRDGDKPAVISSQLDKGHDGMHYFKEQWYQNGKRHRVGGPAILYWDKSVWDYYKDGELHRCDGPAQRRPFYTGKNINL